MKRKSSTNTIALCAMVAGVYTVLCLVLAPLSYGPVQIRIAEALTLLAVFSPTMVIAVTLGCFLSNLVGVMTSANPMILDVFFGTFATGIAAVLSWKFRNIRVKGYPIMSALPPVLVNALIIGAEISLLETGSLFGGTTGVFPFFAATVGLGQVIPCMILGPILVRILERTGLAERYLIPA